MKSFKRLFAAFLSLAILLCSLPIVVSADSSTVYYDTPLTSREDFLWGVQMHTRSWSVNYSTQNVDEQIALATEMGVNVIRVDGTAPTIEQLDKIVKLCNVYGMKVLMIGYFDYSFTEACSTEKAAEITAHIKNLAERYNGLNGHGKIDYMQLSNEVDNAFISAQCDNLGYSTPIGDNVNWYNDTYMSNVAGYFKAAVEGINQVENKPQTIINFSYWHYGFLKGLLNKGVQFDIIGHDWYSDMYIAANNDYYTSVGSGLSNNFDKPILICEGNMRQSEALVATEDSDTAASGYDQLIKCVEQAYANSDVIGFSFYEFCDEPERETENNFNGEAHFGITKYVGRKLVPKQIYYRLKHLIRGDISAEATPKLNPKYKIIDGVAGDLTNTTVPAGASMYPTYKMAKKLGKTIDATTAEYLEFDIYASTATESSFWIWMSDNEDATTSRGAWNVPVLNAGWNHIVIDITSCSRYEKDYDKASFNDFNSIFFEGTPSTTADVIFKVANVVISTDVGVAPDFDTEYFCIDKDDGILNQQTVPVGANMYRTYYMGTEFIKSFDAAKAEYFEFDIYSTVEGTNSFAVWISDNMDSSSNRAVYNIPSLSKGWNHIVLKLTDYVRKESGFSLDSFTNFNSVFFEGVASSTEDVTFYFANLALTLDIKPDEVPEKSYNYNILQEVDSVDLKGSKTNTTDNRYFLWEQYASEGAIDPEVDIAKAEYIEFDYFSVVAETVNFALGTNSDMSFYDVRSNPVAVSVNKGWNHIVISTDEFMGQSSDTASAGIYSPNNVNGILILGANTLYARLTNLALTTTMPNAIFNYTLMDNIDGLIATKYWDTDTTNIYNQHDRRLFITLSKIIDISKAQYLEFDIYADAEMNDLTIWLCNALDGTGRIRKTVKFSELVTPGQWNHIVLDITSYEHMEGNMDKTKWTSVFFEGDPNAADIELTVKIANMGITKDYPDMDNYYQLVDTAIDGIATLRTENTVPAGANMYSTYQMYNSFSAVDVSNADFIELDIYASAATENTISIWSALDATEVRGKWRVPTLNVGWNHIVIDIERDYIGGNNNFTVDGWTSWNGYFFEGTPSNTNTVTFRVANVAVTKDWNEKSKLDYSGELISVFDGYDFTTVTANSKLNLALPPVSLPTAMNLADIDYVEFNLYVMEECDLTFYLSSSATSVFPTTSAAFNLTSLNKGWNSVSIAVSDLVYGSSFKSDSVKRFFFSGVISEERNARFAVEDFAVTSTTQSFKIMKGDYNVDNAVDMCDLIHVVNSALASEPIWFANVSELDGAVNGIIDAADYTALRKVLFASF